MERLKKAADKLIVDSSDPLEQAYKQAAYWKQMAEISDKKEDWQKAAQAFLRQVDLTFPLTYSNILADFNWALSYLKFDSTKFSYGQLTRTYMNLVEQDLVIGKWDHLTEVSLTYLWESVKKGKLGQARFAFDNINTANSWTDSSTVAFMGRAIGQGVIRWIGGKVADRYYSFPEEGNHNTAQGSTRW